MLRSKKRYVGIGCKDRCEEYCWVRDMQGESGFDYRICVVQEIRKDGSMWDKTEEANEVEGEEVDLLRL